MDTWPCAEVAESSGENRGEMASMTISETWVFEAWEKSECEESRRFEQTFNDS